MGRAAYCGFSAKDGGEGGARGGTKGSPTLSSVTEVMCPGKRTLHLGLSGDLSGERTE
jgi:hypothetical protein